MISSPRPETAIFGGNTPCIQVLHKNHLIIVDTGFGCTNLGDILIDRIITNREELTVHIFFTHFHWDHIQGLPFFKPIYFTTTTMHLYSPVESQTMLENLNVLFDGSYSPFESLMSMQAQINLAHLKEPVEIDGLRVEFHAVDHGSDGTNIVHNDAYAFKFTNTEGESVCIITDHEAKNSHTNKSLINFAKNCDILVHDAQYTEAEYASHAGWGHSSVNQALANALKINAGLTVLTHHAPNRNDRDLQTLHRSLLHTPKFKNLNFEFAREDTVYDVAKIKRIKTAG
jgi:phosphoribosyl 1,2-cyclic phosphodiesterase